MSELIDRDDLDERLAKLQEYKAFEGNRQYSHGLRDARNLIAEQTIVNIVHCKDCVHHTDSEIGEGWIDCKTMGRSLKENSFCCFGEMDEDTEREDDGKQ